MPILKQFIQHFLYISFAYISFCIGAILIFDSLLPYTTLAGFVLSGIVFSFSMWLLLSSHRVTSRLAHETVLILFHEKEE